MSDDPFLAHRNLLFTVAYEMLGSAADAEDVVQETWLRWAEVDREAVHDPRAYLVRIVTRQALNRMRTMSRRREDYVGEWLPEPLLTGPDVAEDVELAESLSIATLTVLETLAPPERAVFVLREVFDVPYDEIASAVDKSQDAVRQIASRAHKHVAARRPRIDVSRTEQEQVLRRFLAAFTTGDLQGLMDVLAPDVVLIPDSGGQVQATRVRVTGAKRLASFLTKGVRRLTATVDVTPTALNGGPGARIGIDGNLAAAVSVDVEDGLITRIYLVLNPEKLERLDAEAALAR